MKIFKIICCLLSLCCSIAAYAVAPASSRTVINSNKLVVNEKEKTATFTGSVISKQKSSTLKSDKMMVFYNGVKGEGQNNSIRRIEVYDHVEIITPKERVTSDKGYYEDGVFHLMGNVKMYNGSGVMTGEKFIHNSKTGKSSLVGGNKNHSSKATARPKLIIQPSESAS